MPDLNDLQSINSLYRLATGDTSQLDSIGQDGFAPKQPGADMLPEDYMPMLPTPPARMLPQQMNRNYFVGPAQAQQTGNGTPPDSNLQATLTNIIKTKESTGNYGAVNPHSSASGAYQYTDSTWNGYGGYRKAALAPPEVQDRKFAQDISQRLAAFGNDPYKAIVAHYLPALANQPNKWAAPFKVGGRVVQPALSYLRYVVKGSPLEAGLDDYLHRGTLPNLVASAN